jgi:zinc resistance-associated protein
MKKQHWLAIGAAAVIGLATIQLADANPQGKGGATGPGYGYGRMGQQAMSEEDLRAREEFMTETTGLRKQVATRSAELNALMAQTNPDEKRVAALTGELFDLREQLRQKAATAGLPGGFGMQNCRGNGMGPGMTGGRGMMMGGPAFRNQAQ